MQKCSLLFVALLCFFRVDAQVQQLQKLSQINFPVTCAGVWHYVDSLGNEYALSGNSNGLVIIEVTDPANPQVLFTVPAANSLWREVKTYGHYAFAGTEGGGGITIVDLSDLPNSYNSKTYTGDGAISGQLSSSHTVQVFDGYLYIFGSNIGTVICSLADPWNPAYVGTYSANYVHDGYVLNDTLYASEIYAGQFSVVDVTNKSNPVVLEQQPTPGAFNHNCWFSDDHRYLYTTDEQPNTPVGVFDMSDLSNIQLVATHVNDSLSSHEVHNVRVFNDYILAPSYGSQLTIIDAARPENLIEIARYATGSYLCWDASPYLPSGNIIATDMDGIFYVFAPYYVRACYLEGNITDQVSGLPISGASVQILSTSASDDSDILGDYKTGYPTPGTFTVQVSKPGYITQNITGVSLSSGVLTTLNVQLVPFQTTITVFDITSGNMIPNAKVMLQSGSTFTLYVTDFQGMVQVSNVASGNYDLIAAKWGYRSSCMGVTMGTQSSYDIWLNPGLYDDFTFDFGWTSGGTATSGLWERGEPIGTVFSTTQANPDFDAADDCSDACYVTGNGGGLVNDDDVDDGTAILTSPQFDLTGYTDPYIYYERWFYEQFSSNPAANDTLYIRLSNGALTAVVDLVTGPSPSNSSWVSHGFRVLDYMPATNNMHLIVEISDKPGSSNPLEAAIDKFEVSEGPLAIHLFDAPSQALLIAPNPAGEYTRLLIPGNGNGQPVPVDVLDANGRLVWQGAGQEGSLVTIPTAEWAPGIYIARVKNHSGTPLYGKIVR